jgi:hypothetical protein
MVIGKTGKKTIRATSTDFTGGCNLMGNDLTFNRCINQPRD